MRPLAGDGCFSDLEKQRVHLPHHQRGQLVIRRAAEAGAFGT
ncbi:hypothetical protein ABGB18_40180 [Nonomuraea sp. B12E4]